MIKFRERVVNDTTKRIWFSASEAHAWRLEMVPRADGIHLEVDTVDAQGNVEPVKHATIKALRVVNGRVFIDVQR